MNFLSEGWTSDQMPNLRGKTAVVTGANSGLGFQATKNLAEHDAEVIMACREQEKGKEAKEEIEENLEDAELKVMQLDLASLDSIHSFTEEFKSEYNELDLLFNNAGVMAIPRRETEDGFEYQFGVNHLGHFALTAHLMDTLKSAEEARIISQSSIAHQNGEINFENINHEESYDRMQAYSDSKLANLLFIKELDRKLKENNLDIKAVASHPGVSHTNLFNAEESQHNVVVTKLIGLGLKIFGQTPEKGCLPMLYAATSGDIEGGDFIGPDGFKAIRGNPEKQTPSDKARDEEIAAKLWEKSEEMTEIEFEL
jgi:NAD(P)-dependent dehydrogenase (short-subunit alcohol dehydrogenase family)